MDYRAELLKLIDKFNVYAVEELKEAEAVIIKDSKFSSITKKKDYDGHINMLKKLKKQTQKLNPRSIVIPESDTGVIKLRSEFEKCMVIFDAVCDAYIQMQTVLKSKSEGEQIKYKDYKLYPNKVREARASFNEHMHEMDVLYSDYIDYSEDGSSDEDFGGVKVMTYDDLK